MKRLIIAGAVVTLFLTGCAGMPGAKSAEAPPLQSPTPAVVKDQTVAAQGKLDSPVTIDVPAWYIKAPSSTDDFVYIAGTGYSSDLAMSREKALLDAQMKLADKINGAVNALIKQQKNDNAGNVYTDKTTMTIKKLIANTSVTGYHIEDSKIMSENRNYRTFILIRYPMGDANRLLKDKLQRDNQNADSDEAAQRELDRELEAQKPRPVTRRKAEPAPVVDQPTSKVESVPEPVAVVTPVPASTFGANAVKPLDVSNPEYKARREAALAKGASIEQITIR